MAEVFCGGEACEGRAIDGARVSDRFGCVIVGAGDCGGLLKEAGAEVVWEVGRNAFSWDLCSPRGMSAGKEEYSYCGWGVSGEGQSELVGVCGELGWGE